MPALEEMWTDIDAVIDGVEVDEKSRHWEQQQEQRETHKHRRSSQQTGDCTVIAQHRLSPQQVEKRVEEPTSIGSPVRRFDDPAPKSNSNGNDRDQFVDMLTSFQMVGYYRTLAEQGIDSLQQLCRASKDGLLFQKLKRACVPDRVREVLYDVVQTQSLRNWHNRRRNPKTGTTMVLKDGKLMKKRADGPHVRQTRASRCGAVWRERRRGHLDNRGCGVTQSCSAIMAGAEDSEVKLGCVVEMEQALEQQEQETHTASFDFNGHTLHVRRIPIDLQDDVALEAIFAQYGEVVNIAMPSKSRTQVLRLSWALVTMCDRSAVTAALEDRPVRASNAELRLSRVKGLKKDDRKSNAGPRRRTFLEIYDEAVQRASAWHATRLQALPAGPEALQESSASEEEAMDQMNSPRANVADAIETVRLRSLQTSQLNQAGSTPLVGPPDTQKCDSAPVATETQHQAAARATGYFIYPDGNNRMWVTKTSRTRPNTAPNRRTPLSSTLPKRAQPQTRAKLFRRTSKRHASIQAPKGLRECGITTANTRQRRPLSAPASPLGATASREHSSSSSESYSSGQRPTSSLSSCSISVGTSDRRSLLRSADPPRLREARRPVASNSRGGE